MISTKIFEVPKNCRPNFGKVAERKLEKLPTEFWKSCRTKIGKIAERNLEKLPTEIWKNCRTGIVSFRDV